MAKTRGTDDEPTRGELKDAMANVADFMTENSTVSRALIDTMGSLAHEVAAMRVEMTATREVAAEVKVLRVEMQVTREQMTAYTAFLQGCVERALTGKSQADKSLVDAEVEDRKVIRTRTLKRGKSQDELDKIAAEARWRMIERIISWGLMAMFGLLFGAEKLGYL